MSLKPGADPGAGPGGGGHWPRLISDWALMYSCPVSSLFLKKLTDNTNNTWDNLFFWTIFNNVWLAQSSLDIQLAPLCKMWPFNGPDLEKSYIHHCVKQLHFIYEIQKVTLNHVYPCCYYYLVRPAAPPPCRPPASGSRETVNSLQWGSWPWCTCSTSRPAPSTSSSQSSPTQAHLGPPQLSPHRSLPAI